MRTCVILLIAQFTLCDAIIANTPGNVCVGEGGGVMYYFLMCSLVVFNCFDNAIQMYTKCAFKLTSLRSFLRPASRAGELAIASFIHP